MSPGRWALPSGMFSTRPRMPMALTFALRRASTCISPVTAAAPPISPFMSSMPAPGLIEMPPLSKTTPLPMKATGLSRPAAAPFHCITASRGGLAEPCDTPRSAPMPSSPAFPAHREFRPRRRTASSALAFSANSTGPSTFGGSLTRSRARTTPSATASASANAAVAASGSAVTIEHRNRALLVCLRLVLVLLLGLVAVEGIATQQHAERQDWRRRSADGERASGASMKRIGLVQPSRASRPPRRRALQPVMRGDRVRACRGRSPDQAFGGRAGRCEEIERTSSDFALNFAVDARRSSVVAVRIGDGETRRSAGPRP